MRSRLGYQQEQKQEQQQLSERGRRRGTGRIYIRLGGAVGWYSLEKSGCCRCDVWRSQASLRRDIAATEDP